MKTILIIIGFVISFGLGYSLNHFVSKEKKSTKSTIVTHPEKEGHLKLGAFSVSLSVKDLAASKAFYENLGFTEFGGDMKKGYVIMKIENTLIGLFHGMFENTMLTFNPGWDENAKNIEKFEDIRAIQKHIKSKGIKLTLEADEKTTGPASIMLKDPDGNEILVDQHR